MIFPFRSVLYSPFDISQNNIKLPPYFIYIKKVIYQLQYIFICNKNQSNWQVWPTFGMFEFCEYFFAKRLKKHPANEDISEGQRKALCLPLFYSRVFFDNRIPFIKYVPIAV